MYFDETFMEGDLGYEAEYAQKSKARVVLIMYRKDGRGGIQGIIVDSFYVNNDGKIANEFYVVTDSDEGEIKRLENYHGIRKLEDGIQIQKAFYQYFLKQQKRDNVIEIANNN